MTSMLCPHRKRYLMRLCVISVMELKKPELMFRIVGSMSAFKIRCVCVLVCVCACLL